MNINEYIKKLESVLTSKTDPKITVTIDDPSLSNKVSVTSNISQILDTFKTFSINLLDEQISVLINEYHSLKSKPEEETDYPKKVKVYCKIGFKCGYGDSSVSFYANMKDLEGANLLRVYQNSYNTKGRVDNVAMMHFELDVDYHPESIAETCIRYLLSNITTATITSIQLYTLDGEPLLDPGFLRDYAMVADPSAFLEDDYDIQGYQGEPAEEDEEPLAHSQNGQVSVVGDPCTCGRNGAVCQCDNSDRAAGTAVDPDHAPPRSSTAVDSTSAAPWEYYNPEPVPEGKAPRLWSVVIQETPETAEYVIQNIIIEPVVRDGRLLFATSKSRYSMDESKIFAWHCNIVP